MSTSFNFPANPSLNQIVVLPDGNSAQWNGYAWVSVADNVTYPLAIPKGGTGATNPATARINLGLNTATGEFVVQQDGTVTLPGMAFNSEPGLGFFRSAASVIGMAAQGATAFYVNAGTAAAITAGIVSRAPGSAQLELRNSLSTGNANQLRLTQNADGSAEIAATGFGTFTRGRLLIDAGQTFFRNTGGSPNVALDKVAGQNNFLSGTQAGLTRWAFNLGDSAAESGSNVGSDFNLSRFNDAGVSQGAVLTIVRSTGAWFVPGPINVTGAVSAGTLVGNVVQVNSSGGANWAVVTLNAATGGGTLEGRRNGVARWAITIPDATAESGGNVGSDFAILRYDNAGAYLGTPIYIQRSSGVVSFASAIVNGPSDRRLKENIQPIADALDRVLALEGVSFNMIATPGQREIGLIAQDVAPVVPEVMQPYGEDRLALDYPKLTALLINAVKTLNQRLTQLEHT